MANYRKLGRKSDVRNAMLRSQATALLAKGKIITTEARAKELRKYVEPLIALAVREKDNFETVTVTAKVPKKDANGKRVKEERDGKKVVVFDEVQKEINQKEIKKDKPSRLHARSMINAKLYDVTEVDAKKKKARKKVDLAAKLFDEYGPKYAERHGGYTRIVKIGLRKGDAAMEVLMELV